MSALYDLGSCLGEVLLVFHVSFDLSDSLLISRNLYLLVKVYLLSGLLSGEIKYEIHEFNAFNCPAWYADGVAILKELSRLGIESEVYLEKARILDFQRKKTTQKVNLYEKVQIPGYQEAIRKIKRYMEDEENLSKAASKIVKCRHEIEEEEQNNG